MEDEDGRFCLAGFYVSARELVWLAVTVAAEALLAGYIGAAGFSLPALLLLAIPALFCWAGLKLQVDGAVIERWVLDMSLFAIRGRVLASGRTAPLRNAACLSLRIEYVIDCPDRSLGRGTRTNSGFRFKTGA